MKVGILSMQQIKNYGSFLQAYALKSTIERLGHEVKFINIIKGEQIGDYKISKLHNLRQLIKRLNCKRPFENLKYTIKLHKRFDREFLPELGVYKGLVKEHFDVVIIGSDEVFNCAQITWFGFSTQLFGENINADRVISYAACFGSTTIAKLEEMGVASRVGNLLSAFTSLSVRDKNSFNIIKALTGRMPCINIDPVLLYNYQCEIKKVKCDCDYMLIYTYPGRLRDKIEVSAIIEYAKKYNLKIICIANYFDWVDMVVTPHPFEVLSYFKNAFCIVTDTFHGSVMSIKFNKNFATIIRGMNNQKISYLLEQFNLSDRVFCKGTSLENILSTSIDYYPVNQIINNEINSSLNYLKTNL